MATADTIIKHRDTDRWYTVEGWADAVNQGQVSDSYAVVKSATRYDITVKAIDPDSCSLWYSEVGDGTNRSVTRTEYGTSVTRKSNTGATSEISFSIYKVDGAFRKIYGAHPAHPGVWNFYTDVGGCVMVETKNAARYSFSGGNTFVEGVYSSVAANLQSGTEYAASKITYRNGSPGKIWIGATSGAYDSTLMVSCGYYFWVALNPGSISWTETPNTGSRTVASGKKRALVTDIEDYNSGSNASLTTTTSSGSTTFAFWHAKRQGLGPYLPNSTSKVLAPLTRTTTGGDTVVLRGVNTSSDGTGTFYPVGSDIADIVTRRPSLTTYDFRITLYGVWSTRYTLAINANGGTGAASIWYSPETGKFYADEDLTTPISTVTPFTKSSAQFLGLYTADNTSSTKAVDADGSFTSWIPTTGCTLYAQWRTVVEVELNQESGTGGTDAIWYDSVVGGFVYPNGTTAISAIAVPRMECFAFLGYFTAASGGTKYIDADGTLLAALTGNPPASALTLYAQWQRVSWRMTLDACGGTDGDTAIYCNGAVATFYRDDALANVIDSVVVPERRGYSFLGYFTAASGGTKVIDENGGIGLSAFAQNGTIYAQWLANTYTIEFNPSGGSVSVDTMSVTFGQAVGSLPTPTRPADRPDAIFKGWRLDGDYITAATVWDFVGADTFVLVAHWLTAFGSVEDYFGLASSALVPISSDSGDVYKRVAVTHGGKYESGVNARSSGIWRNPTVTYVVKANTTVAVKLGQAFPAVKSGSTMTRSGYMISSVEIVTEVGKFPTVTVSAVANEGKNAVNNFTVNKNKFDVSVPVVARSKAQNLLNAISGGGNLQRFILTATCDPVVCEEKLMPCASDIVNGRFELSAETLCASIENAPVASGGFVVVDTPQILNESDYIRYAVEARREMV